MAEEVELDNATVLSTEELNASNLTGRAAATTEGIAITYCSLLLMALGPIFIGACRSVTYHSDLRVSGDGCTVPPD